MLKLMRPLDYEKKFLHQVQIIANDRAETADQVFEVKMMFLLELCFLWQNHIVLLLFR